MRDALDPEISDHDLPSWMRFDMHHWGHLSPNKPLTACGTACCIGGSMEMHLAGLTSKLDVGDQPSSYQAITWHSSLYNVTGHYSSGSPALGNLFYAYPSEPEDRTRTKAVEAIDRFLAGNIGDPWLTWA